MKLFKDVHPGVKLITLATSIRWTSWAIIDPILPIFLYTLVQSYGGTGIFRSTYNLIFILCLPIVGHIANRVSAKYIIIAGLCFYPFISLSYYAAGVWGLAIFAILAKALNAIGYSLDDTGRCAYFRRHMPKNGGKAFGYFETVTSIWYILSIVIAYFIIDKIEFKDTFIWIIPTVLMAILIILKIPKDSADATGKKWKQYINFRSYKRAIKEFRLWSIKLKKIALVSFFSSLVFTITDFFMPLMIFFQEENLKNVVLFAGVASIPGLFGFKISKMVEKSGNNLMYRSLSLAALALFMFIFTNNFIIQLLLIFIINTCAIAVSISIDNRSTLLGDKKRYGTISSLFSELGALSGIIGPIVFGFLTDFTSMNVTIIVGALILYLTSLFSSRGLLLNTFRKTKEV